jgi:hypothetical protein
MDFVEWLVACLLVSGEYRFIVWLVNREIKHAQGP